MNGHKEVVELISRYFTAIYAGHVSALRDMFHPKIELFGEIKGESYQKSLTAYLEGVAGRKSPQQLGEPFVMKLLAVEVVGKIAMSKLSVRMLGFNYVVFLTLARGQHNWLIVSKTLTHVEDQ